MADLFRVHALLNPFKRIRKWAGTRVSEKFGSSLRDILRGLLTVKKSNKQETFEHAVDQQQLKETDLQVRMLGYYWLSVLCFSSMCGMLSYGIYLFHNGHFPGGLVAIGMSAAIFAIGFRYHFWYFQIKQRRLGCTFKEWFNQGILGRK